ncbi:hypothetical protein T484DRAFT_1849178 [Baffinella frigidus]|nr:hypothetical protein T484DRAFT_1849178 [Cryptophyta sp. CCMP2293]
MEQTEELRKRHRALEHLPLSAELKFAEMDVSSLVSRRVAQVFAGKLRERDAARKARRRREEAAVARVEKEERRKRTSAPPPPDLFCGPSLMAAMAAAQGDYDEAELAMLFAQDGLPPLPSQMLFTTTQDCWVMLFAQDGLPHLPSQVNGMELTAALVRQMNQTSPGTSPAAGGVAGGDAGARWSQMAQGRREVPIAADAFPSLGGSAFPSLASASPPKQPASWGRPAPVSPALSASSHTKAAAPPAAATLGARAFGAMAIGGRAGGAGWAGAGAGAGAGEEEGVFDMDEDVSEEERRRRTAIARDRAWDAALAAAAPKEKEEGAGPAELTTDAAKKKSGRKHKQDLLP